MEVRLPLGMLSGLSSHPVLSSRFLDVNRTLFAQSGIIASALFAEADRKNENKGLGEVEVSIEKGNKVLGHFSRSNQHLI